MSHGLETLCRVSWSRVPLLLQLLLRKQSNPRSHTPRAAGQVAVEFCCCGQAHPVTFRRAVRPQLLRRDLIWNNRVESVWLALVVVWCSAAHPPVGKRAPRDQQERCGWKKKNRERGGGTQLARRGFYKRPGGVFIDREHRSYPSRCAYTVFCVRCSGSPVPSTSFVARAAAVHHHAPSARAPASCGDYHEHHPGLRGLPRDMQPCRQAVTRRCGEYVSVLCLYTAVRQMLLHCCTRVSSPRLCTCLTLISPRLPVFRFSRELDVCMYALRAPSAVLFDIYITQSATVGKVPTTLPYQCTTARRTRRAARASHTAG